MKGQAKPKPGSDEFLAEHGIRREVWERRPYLDYAPQGALEEFSYSARTDIGLSFARTAIAPSGLKNVFEEYGDGGLYDDQIKFAKKIAEGGEQPYRDQHPKTEDGGLLIVRHAPRGLEHYGKVYAEMRPHNPVATKLRTWHYHGLRPYPPHVALTNRGLPRKPKEAGGGPIGETRNYTSGQMQEHIDRRVYEDDHFEGDERLDRVHCHQELAKYTFLMGHWFTQKRQRKDGSWYETKKQDTSESIARRIDIHPLALERFKQDAGLVYFCMEGCLKADAILSEIIRRDLDESVVSVPSVTLWRAEELVDFINLYLRGQRVVLVCDADGARNPKVRTQALLLRSYLWTRGVYETEIVAPPYPGSKQKRALGYVPKRRKLDEPIVWERGLTEWVIDPSALDNGGKPQLNGVDDLIGDALKHSERAPLKELKRLGNQIDADVAQWIVDHPRKNEGKNVLADLRDALALEAVLIHAAPPDEQYSRWTYWSSAEMLAAVMDFDVPKSAPAKKVPYQRRKAELPAKFKRMQRALTSLCDRGALEKIEGSEEIEKKSIRTKKGLRTTECEWVDRPRYQILATELDPTELTRRALGELPEVEFYNEVADGIQARGFENVKSVAIGEGPAMQIVTISALDERLARVELIESMHAEEMDSIRSTVNRVVARLEDDRFTETARELGYLD